MSRHAIGSVVSFDFTLYRVSLADPIHRRTGIGEVVDNEDFSTWPVGYALRVVDSPNYSAGEIVHVAPHNTAAMSRQNG